MNTNLTGEQYHNTWIRTLIEFNWNDFNLEDRRGSIVYQSKGVQILPWNKLADHVQNAYNKIAAKMNEKAEFTGTDVYLCLMGQDYTETDWNYLCKLEKEFYKQFALQLQGVK